MCHLEWQKVGDKNNRNYPHQWNDQPIWYAPAAWGEGILSRATDKPNYLVFMTGVHVPSLCTALDDRYRTAV